MNTMRKLVFLGVILGVIALSVGCQPGLSEKRVRDIVEEEVTRRLATVDELTVSKLFIENEDGKRVAMFGVEDEHVLLLIFDVDRGPIVGLGELEGTGFLTIYNANGENVVGLTSVGNRGSLSLRNTYGEIVVLLGSVDNEGVLTTFDKDGQTTFEAP